MKVALRFVEVGVPLANDDRVQVVRPGDRIELLGGQLRYVEDRQKVLRGFGAKAVTEFVALLLKSLVEFSDAFVETFLELTVSLRFLRRACKRHSLFVATV